MSSANAHNSGSRRRGGYKRRQSHAAAQSEPFRPRKVPQHPLVPAGEPELIDTDQALTDLLEHVRQVGRCCYDSEFIGESFYFPHLCLVQVATPQRVAVIDALARLDLRPIWEMLSDESVEKIVHAGAQDLEPVVRHLGRAPANVFDTQIVAGLAGLPYPLSLTRLTQSLLDVRLGKGLTFTSWDQRPLSTPHLHYAADDVRFGPALHAELLGRLERLGRVHWARQQCGSLCDASRYRLDLTEVARKIRGAKDLRRPQAAVLCELVGLRDEIARLHDLPPRSTLRDEVLLDLARRSPVMAKDLDSIRGLPRPIKADFGSRLLEAVGRGLEKRQPPWATEPQHDETPEEQFRVDTLWAAAQAWCRSLGVDPSLVATRSDLGDAIRTGVLPPRVAHGWRGELLGEFAAKFLAGDRRIELRWNGAK